MTERSDRPPIAALGDRPPPEELARRVRECLAAGELVGLPTETVYGLAVRADDERAVRAVRELKGRPLEAGLTWHVHERAVLERFAVLRPLAARLAERYWPGPLTLVLQGVPDGLEHVAQAGWTGVRMPAHEATLALLARCEFPVALTSANQHGEPPLTQAGALARAFGPSLALVVDGGPCRLGESSGVLRLGPGRFHLLREGLLCLEDLRRTAGLRILFVCTGNTCRSPIAEALARALLGERLGVPPGRIEGFGFELASRGLNASIGQPASPLAVEVLGRRGLDLSEHRARMAVPETCMRHDRIYGLTRSHLELLQALLPPGRASIELLDPRGLDIADPIGGSRETYERCVGEIEEALRLRLDEWA